MIRFIRVNLKFAKYIGVQTETMKSRMSKLYKIPRANIFVISNAISFTSSKANFTFQRHDDSKPIKLLFLSKYYPQKNFEILYDLAKKIKDRNLPIRFTITIDECENDRGKRFLTVVKQLGLDSVITNIGNVKLENISNAYEEHDGLFLPTLLESFSGTYLEAMYFCKPIFTSNMDFAIDVCKDAAFYFDPLDSEDIINTISNAFQMPDLMKSKVNLGQKYVQNAKSWNDIGNFIDSQILKL